MECRIELLDVSYTELYVGLKFDKIKSVLLAFQPAIASWMIV